MPRAETRLQRGTKRCCYVWLVSLCFGLCFRFWEMFGFPLGEGCVQAAGACVVLFGRRAPYAMPSFLQRLPEQVAEGQGFVSFGPRFSFLGPLFALSLAHRFNFSLRFLQPFQQIGAGGGGFSGVAHFADRRQVAPDVLLSVFFIWFVMVGDSSEGPQRLILHRDGGF
jgi:hypothetical protein